LFTLRIKESSGGSKFVFSISKKIDKRATKRNSIKRLFKASLNNLLKEKIEKQLLFIIGQEAKKRSQKEIESEIEKVLIKEKIII
jgi:ribonuclease P protein component